MMRVPIAPQRAGLAAPGSRVDLRPGRSHQPYSLLVHYATNAWPPGRSVASAQMRSAAVAEVCGVSIQVADAMANGAGDPVRETMPTDITQPGKSSPILRPMQS